MAEQQKNTLITVTRNFSAMPLVIPVLVFVAIAVGRRIGLSGYGMLVAVLGSIFTGFGALLYSAWRNARDVQEQYLQQQAQKTSLSVQEEDN